MLATQPTQIITRLPRKIRNIARDVDIHELVIVNNRSANARRVPWSGAQAIHGATIYTISWNMVTPPSRWWDRSWYASDRSRKLCTLIILQSIASNQYPTQQTINRGSTINSNSNFSMTTVQMCSLSPMKGRGKLKFGRKLSQLLSQLLFIVWTIINNKITTFQDSPFWNCYSVYQCPASIKYYITQAIGCIAVL